jgi:aspartate/methionine/tyrosine aminotransferase
VLTANGVSKAYVLAEGGIGRTAGPGQLISRIECVISQDASRTASYGQAAGAALCRESEPSVGGLVDATTEDGETLVTDSDVARWVVHAAHVATIAGEAYDMPSYLPISFATFDKVTDGSRARLAEVIAPVELPKQKRESEG